MTIVRPVSRGVFIRSNKKRRDNFRRIDSNRKRWKYRPETRTTSDAQQKNSMKKRKNWANIFIFIWNESHLWRYIEQINILSNKRNNSHSIEGGINISYLLLLLFVCLFCTFIACYGTVPANSIGKIEMPLNRSRSWRWWWCKDVELNIPFVYRLRAHTMITINTHDNIWICMLISQYAKNAVSSLSLFLSPPMNTPTRPSARFLFNRIFPCFWRAQHFFSIALSISHLHHLQQKKTGIGPWESHTTYSLKRTIFILSISEWYSARPAL